jgi:hypothetical protein
MRWLGGAVGIVVAVLILSPAGGARPTADQRVRHGEAIGPIRLGMTPTEVRRVLGRESAVSARERRGTRGHRYLELQWDYAWWTIGFMRPPNGGFRAVRIGTVARGQRTAERLGVGSSQRVVRQELPVFCREVSVRGGPWIHTECIYRRSSKRQTVLVFGGQGEGDNVRRVDEIEVRDTLFYLGWRVRID